MITTSRLADLFVEVADTLVDDFDLVDFLHNLTKHAAAITGAGAVGLLLSDHRGALQFMAANNETGEMLELLQLQNQEGPCLECFHTRAAVSVVDLSEEVERWPDFAPRAIAAGFGSVHAVPMRLRDRVIGALNLFGTEHTAFADDELRVVQALADVATIAILQERSIARATVLTEQLQGALNSRVIIEQAKGAVAQYQGVDVDEAFGRLRSHARSTGRRLVDVAAEVLEDPGLLGGSTPA